MKKILNLLLVLAVLVSASACSKRVLTSSQVKITKNTVLTDTLVHVKVPVPIKKIEVDTTLRDTKVILPKGVDKVVIKKENKDMKVHVTIDSLGRVTIKAETKLDSINAVVKLQNKTISEQKEIIKEYEKRDAKLGILVKRLGSGLAGAIFAILLLVIVAYRIYKKAL